MNVNDLKSINVNNLGTAPGPIKAFLALVLLILICFLGYHFLVKKQLATLEKKKAEEVTLKKTFEEKYHKSANLEIYKQQLEDMQINFGEMLRQLPGKSEIPGVVDDVSQTGLASGLEIVLFRPSAEVEKGFYAEKPIQINVTGTFEEMANFASGIAALPRIVTLHNITLQPAKAAKKNPSNNSNRSSAQQLSMGVVAKTYRYLDDEEDEE